MHFQGLETFLMPLALLDWWVLGSIGSEKHLGVPQSFLNVSLKVEEVIQTL